MKLFIEILLLVFIAFVFHLKVEDVSFASEYKSIIDPSFYTVVSKFVTNGVEMDLQNFVYLKKIL